ncbi:alpha-(1-_3)-arabinofuranosyltransferase family protein [Corynebacterium sp. NPDC060344]|uniref:alpha-(1->3)-arabinofuranosyltransferase domain-containing protein n=1 Tax=Corynebacterium sp. NPDC060344 TaxID=3347101 RepID=UPI0036530A28
MPTTDRRTPTRALVGWWALLCLLAFIQSPGRTVADTKHDLTANPTGFLERSLSMWSEVMPLGQLQNQAYGYLFPQGPFFALFDLLPDAIWADWLTQGLWWSLLLCLAFTGFYRVAEVAGIGTRQSRILAALLYALSPRILTTLGAISSEAWPVALAPWILLPLLVVARRPDAVGWKLAVRAVVLSGLAVLCTGAVNAVGTAAACVPAALVLVFAGFSGPHRKRAWAMFAGWLGACAAVSMWWIVPLLMLGSYSPPFTDYIESSGVTTRWLNLGETLRGATSWAPFVSLERVGGNAIVSEPVLILATMAIAAIGLVGLAMGSMPGRRGWLLMALIGIASMAAWTDPFAPLGDWGRSLLDGPLAPLRNLHKMDPAVRLPLMLGLAHATAMLPWPGSGREVGGDSDRKQQLREKWLHPEKHRSAVVAMLVLVAAAGATAPAWSARLAPTGAYQEVPSHWTEAADWLNANAGGARTLVAPSMPFADMDWGFTRDEPLQPLTDVPWVVRDAVPLVPPEAIRGLDGVQELLDRGEGVDSLAATLRNQGIGYVLVRSDLPAFNRGTGLRDLRATLQASPGMSRVAEFAHGGDGAPTGAVSGKTAAAVTIWAVDGGADALAPRMVDSSSVPLVSGGPEVLARLDEVDGDAPVRMLHGEAAGTVTDTPTRRGRNYGEVRGAVSGLLAPDEDTGVTNEVADYPAAGIAETQTATGRASLEVSSSASEPYNVGGARPEHSMNALVDGDPTTWWEPRAGTGGQAEWVEMVPEEHLDGGRLTITAAVVPAQVQVRAGGASTSKWLTPGEPMSMPLPRAVSGSGSDADADTDSDSDADSDAGAIRITATNAPAGFALAEITLENSAGEDVTPIRLPVVPDASPLVQRWSFGQEIPEDRLRRAFTVPAPITVTVDADTCRTGLADPWTELDGEPVACGDTVDLEPGMHEIGSRARWVTLTGADYAAPTREQQDPQVIEDFAAGTDSDTAIGSGTIAASDADRIVYRPVSVNPGQVADIDGRELEPVTVNGWQQGWLVPAGVAGTLTIDFPAAATWRTGILAGGGLAALFALVAVAIGFACRRPLPTAIDTADMDPAQVPDLHRNTTAIAGFAVAWLTAGLPGAAVAAILAVIGVNLVRRCGAETIRRQAIAATAALAGIAGIILARDAWPGAGYAGFEWPLQLVAVGAVVLASFAQTLPNQRRAGSSTNA